MTTNQSNPIPDSYWVKPGRLLAGEYPRNLDDASSRIKLRRLLEAGVTLFLEVSLLEETVLGVGTGQWGEEIMLTPENLIRACRPILVNLTDREQPVWPDTGAER